MDGGIFQNQTTLLGDGLISPTVGQHFYVVLTSAIALQLPTLPPQYTGIEFTFQIENTSGSPQTVTFDNQDSATIKTFTVAPGANVFIQFVYIGNGYLFPNA